MSRLLSFRAFERLLRIPREEMERITKEIHTHYRPWPNTNRRTGKVRIIRSPSPELKHIQRRIAKRVLNDFELGPEVHGGVRGRSPRTNAIAHLAKDCVVTIDVRKFFPSVRHTLVYRMLRWELGFGRDVARIITRLVTYKGQLPQGAPTSPILANLFLRLAVDALIVAEAQKATITYTRFIDDVALSGLDPRLLINLVARSLTTRRLAISRKDKLRIMPRSMPQKITGLLVNGEQPSIPKDRRDQVRAAIHEFGRMSAGPIRDKALRSIRGRIAYVRQFNAGNAARLERQLQAIETGR